MAEYAFVYKPAQKVCANGAVFIIGYVDLRPMGMGTKKTFFIDREVSDFKVDNSVNPPVYILTCSRELDFKSGEHSNDYRKDSSRFCDENTSFWTN